MRSWALARPWNRASIALTKGGCENLRFRWLASLTQPPVSGYYMLPGLGPGGTTHLPPLGFGWQAA